MIDIKVSVFVCIQYLCQVAFGDEIEAVQKEAKALKEGGVEIIIALGHSGYDIDQVIQRQQEQRTATTFCQKYDSVVSLPYFYCIHRRHGLCLLLEDLHTFFSLSLFTFTF